MLHTLNILSRGAVIVVGVLMLAGTMRLFPADFPLNETFGVIVSLFGAYRLVQYISARSREQVDGEDDE